MAIRPFLHGLLFFFALATPLLSKPEEGQLVQGHDFEGVIFTPSMVRSTAQGSSISENPGLWTPSKELILKAEAALPAAIAEKVKYSKPTRGSNYPVYYSAKNHTDLNLTNSPKPPDISDSEIEDNFLYDVVDSKLKYRRQYIGETINGKKVLLLNLFIRGDETDSFFKTWRYQWARVLDGAYYFWQVDYDPNTNTFSDWGCGGYSG